jgi:hypothetical protein
MPALKKVEKPGRAWAVTNLARRIAGPRVRFPAPAAAAILDQSVVLAPERADPDTAPVLADEPRSVDLSRLLLSGAVSRYAPPKIS